MSTTIVWLMIIVSGNGNVWNSGPEFTSKERCEVAAQAMQKTVDDLRWGMNIRKPVCMKIEK